MNTDQKIIATPEVATQNESSLLYPIRFKTNFTYNKRVPTLTCNATSGGSEIARWVLDIHQILRIEEKHAIPYATSVINKITGMDGIHNNPVLTSTDRLIFTPESIIQHYDQFVPAEQRLFPESASLQNEVVELYRQFTTTLDQYVWQYVFTELFRSKKNTKELLKKGATNNERWKLLFGYGAAKKTIAKQQILTNENPIVYLLEIQKVFKDIDQRLSDGRRYLTGNTFTAADLAFAATVAPIILPEEYGGDLYSFSEISEELRQEIIDLRATAAGQFALRLYQEDRPINLNLGKVPEAPGAFKRALNRLLIKLSSKQYKIFYFLQKNIPVLRIGLAKIAVVSRHDLVVDVLNRDEDFTIKEINAKKMANQKGTFFLGMDRSNPQFDRERNFVRKTAKKEDIQFIQNFIRTQADALCKQAQPYQKLDVVQHLNYVVLLGVLDQYFGVPAPVNSQMKRWQRTMFYDLFLNFTNNEEKHLAAVNSGKERTAWVRQLISERRQQLAEGKTLDDNLLNRMILLSNEAEYSWVDDDIIRRNIGGLLTGIQETTSKAVIFALQELFKRPKQLKGAIEAAKAYDTDTLRGYVYEGLRFNPVQPGVLRFCETKQIVKGTGKKSYTIKGGYKLMPLTSGAMFDPVTFPKPKQFNPNRDARYMNWGFALHECYGKYINAVSIPELVAAVLRLENVQPIKGSAGRGAGLQMGPFPNNYVVTFTTTRNN